jgi:PAS domain S-box-containing protein
MERIVIISKFIHVSIYIADAILLFILYQFGSLDFSNTVIILSITIFLLAKIIFHFIVYHFFVGTNISKINEILNSFKKGKYTFNHDEYKPVVSSYFSYIIESLKRAGRNFDKIISTLKDDMEKFRELYNNIVLSANSYFVVTNQRDEILFANKSFCTNFRYRSDEIVGMKLNEVFFIPPGRFSESYKNVKQTGESTVLQKIKLLSRKKVSIIADIKISRITEQGEKQFVIVLDDVTTQWRKDYQISLISQITESIQRDDEVDRILNGILTAVTSGSGLGFNRAMLFLYNDEKKALCGKMAVGPDSFDEAVKIWGSMQNEDPVDYAEAAYNLEKTHESGKQFYRHVISGCFPIEKEDNPLVSAHLNRVSIHIYDAYHDERVDKASREFIDVSEFVVVPLCSSNKSLGVIVADNKFNNSPIYDDHVELLSIFAVQAALTLDSYESLAHVKEKMERIQSRQDAIVESEKMAAVGRIAAHIAHEIRNPLVTVGGYARRILQNIHKTPTPVEKVEKSAEIILHESERLEKILSNVMDFSRPSPLIREYNNINDVINDTYSLLKNVFQERKITPVLELGDNLPLVKSDFNQLKQVVLNLIQNAMDATPPNGQITIQTAIVDKKILIRVLDTGSGISNENIEKVFDPFYTSKVTGVGLGLAVVKKIINDHNGNIKVNNRKEGGAEFTVELPM